MVVNTPSLKSHWDDSTFGSLDERNLSNYTTITTVLINVTSAPSTEAILFSQEPGAGRGWTEIINVTGNEANLPHNDSDSVVETKDRILMVGIITGAIGLLLGILLTLTIWLFLRRKRSHRRKKKGPQKNPKEMTFEELDLTLVHGNYDTSGTYQEPLPTHRHQNAYHHERSSKPPRSSFHEVEMTHMDHPSQISPIGKHNSSTSVFCPIDIHVGSYQSFDAPSPPHDDDEDGEYGGRSFMPYRGGHRIAHQDQMYPRSISQENDLGTSLYQYPATRSHTNDVSCSF